MYLTALTRRDDLFDVAMRWLNGDIGHGDAQFVKQVFIMENAITGPAVEQLSRDVAQPLGPGHIRLHFPRTKDAVRQLIMDDYRKPTERAQKLFADYRARPQDFFPTTPVDIAVATNREDKLVGMMRQKRLMRIADKAARKVITCFDHEMQHSSERLGSNRSTSSSDGEAYLCREFESGRFNIDREEVRIDDVIGTKIVASSEKLAEVEAAIFEHPSVISVRRSEHHGDYRDIHLEVDMRCAEKGPTVDHLRKLDWDVGSSRGLDPLWLSRDIPNYVEAGSEQSTVEIILTTWDELIESEFGRSLHEQRIVAQRTDPRFSSQLAMNIGLAFLYLMLVAISPTAQVTDAPVKLSGRHLPDSIFGSFAVLFGLDIARSPFLAHHEHNEDELMPL